MTRSGFEPKEFKGVTRPPKGSGVEPALVEVGARSVPQWEYQWEDTLNAVSERAVAPPLPSRITAEVATRSVSGLGTLIFVRGELGIGKTTLVRLLEVELLSSAEIAADTRTKNALLTCSVLEANALESPEDFAKRVNSELVDTAQVVALARPGTLDAATQWISRTPDAAVTIRTFEPGRVVFRQCLAYVALEAGLGADGEDALGAMASRLPPFLRTPFYFHEIANALRTGAVEADDTERSPLELVRASLERRIGKRSFDEVVACAYGRISPEDIEVIAGVLEHDGFRHDGYRSVILAATVFDYSERFGSLVRVPNALPAITILLDQIQHAWRHRPNDIEEGLMAELRDFVANPPPLTEVPALIYVQSLVADTFRRLRDEAPAEVLQTRCLELIDRRGDRANIDAPADTVWWDVSDALSRVGDPRLIKARRGHYGEPSSYFTSVDHANVEIGSDFIPERLDAAKPVLPYARQSVSIGPMWVANFLVTNEEFASFWTDSKPEQHFRFTGRQWMKDDPQLMDEIRAAFEVAARRCFWKETQEQQTVAVAGIAQPGLPILELARNRAVRKGRIALWDPTQADVRFSARGNPVVGVTWWEAMAYCCWWEATKLGSTGLPLGSTVSLLSDWEWEAVRRLYYEPVSTEFMDGTTVSTNRYPAHLRSFNATAATQGRLTNVMRPLHVGIAPVPNGSGPLDMVGNVWEWTRSRVFGRVIESTEAQGDFGFTAWEDGNAQVEQIARSPERDRVDQLNDLSYRAVRGGSFFSIDEQAAWHPAYRLCDPPFSSYFDLGFRIVVYPPGGAQDV